ncbi:hypothetical protein R1flu_026266 [Riccia fluitans]|uniref:BTB/POZ domain-containing protein n=1 Tax=Riccia fluitans TaxID=41844 RepID=A0ABD1XJI2_9MARC
MVFKFMPLASFWVQGLLYSRQMFSCGMSETRSNVVPLPSVGSSVLFHVLRFLYAGEIEFYHTGIDMPCHHSSGLNSSVHPGHDWKPRIEVLIAARFFLLDSLVIVTLRRMWACLSEKVHGMSSENFLNSVADGLSTLSIGSSTLMGTEEKEARFIEAIRIRIVQILASNDMSGLTLSKLSKEAFSYYLDKTQNPWDHTVWKWSLEEYKKLIQLCGWSAVQNEDEPAEFENLFCLPSPVSAARYLLDRDELRLFGNPVSTVIENRKRLDTDAVKKTLQDILPLIDLPSIHPEVLVEVINPFSKSTFRKNASRYRQ